MFCTTNRAIGARRSLSIRCLLFLALAIYLSTPSAAAESLPPWANPKLPVKQGLLVWLDPSAENEARKQAGQPPLADADSIETLHDASGNARDVVQADPASRPRIRLDDKLAFLQFDGRATHLAHVGPELALRDVTLFVVAAPHDNLGDFTALCAMNAADQNDYVSGLNIDQGPFLSEKFDVINVEGAGFGGVQNLKVGRSDFSKLHRVCFRTSPGMDDTALFVDGAPAGKRSRQDVPIRLQRFTVGARFYAHGQPPQTSGFFHGEIAEVLVYDRRLKDAEIASVDGYLREKFGDQRPVPVPPPPAGVKPLVRVEHPPAVQVLVPGFSVRELPIDLPNINNVLYREDGKLVTLGYDGNLHLLDDTNGDGLEDRAHLFWENKGKIRDTIGMALTLPGDERGRGAIVASRAKCLMIVDTDGDDLADREIVVGEGWNTTAQGIDACGVAVDPRNGSIYFGLGCADFTNGYQLDESGQSQFDLQSRRGTITRVFKDLQRSTTICTGLRFPVALRFNHLGDLFCTDQEGATWLPNGNPYDELLCIERGRHYGFPPRHPTHLPNVVDEPSVFDYRPQHQSTCGFNFNEPVNGGPVFGPAAWQHDAFVAGYSRGKIYRTRVVKTGNELTKNDTGYVGQNHLFATLQLLTADVCISPRGELVVATHSGGPDWGSGPQGRGKLFQIRYSAKEAPQPVAIWAATPGELRIAFDKPLEPERLRDLAQRASIDAGEFVAAGDRFETIRPGYAVVANQLRTGRRDVRILGAQVTPDRRTLIFSIVPQTAASNYAISLPGLQHLGASPVDDLASAGGNINQLPDVELQTDLCGVEALWTSSDGVSSWCGWLPHVDLEVSRQLTIGSSAHDELWQRLAQPGRLTLKTQLDLKQMLQPATQPGSKLDYEPPRERITVACQRTPGWHGGEFAVMLAGQEAQPGGGEGGKNDLFDYRHVVNVDPQQALQELTIITATGQNGVAPHLSLHFIGSDPQVRRAFPLRRFLLPWARPSTEAMPTFDNRDTPELAGGNWLRGRHVFLSEEASCSKCHRARGEGGAIGPDLSNLIHRDYASVSRDIAEPSYAINPDYLTQLVALEDGRLLTGSVRTQGDQLIVGDQQGRETFVARGEVSELQPSPQSIMPADLAKKLGPDKLRDLLTFLLTEPPHMPDYGRGTPPAPRTRDEVLRVLAGAPDQLTTRPLRILLVAGNKDHGPGEHDYPAWRNVWQQLLALAPETTVATAHDWPAAEELAKADVAIFYQQGKWNPDRARDIDAFLARGGGLVYIHYAVDGGADAPGFAQRIGLAWTGGSRFRHGDLDLQFRLPAKHPIARNFDKLHLHDESYWNLVGDATKITLLATGREEDREQPLFWTTEPGKGRVFVSIPGHFSWTFDDPLFRVVLLRAIAWTAREPIDRFNELVWPGARVQ